MKRAMCLLEANVEKEWLTDSGVRFDDIHGHRCDVRNHAGTRTEIVGVAEVRLLAGCKVLHPGEHRPVPEVAKCRREVAGRIVQSKAAMSQTDHAGLVWRLSRQEGCPAW